MRWGTSHARGSPSLRSVRALDRRSRTCRTAARSPMTTRGGRTQPCDRTQARTRLDNAEKSLDVTELVAAEREIPDLLGIFVRPHARLVHPAAVNNASCRASRARFFAILVARELASVTAGSVPCFGQPCQKHPSMNRETRCLVKTTSGRIARCAAGTLTGRSTRTRKAYCRELRPHRQLQPRIAAAVRGPDPPPRVTDSMPTPPSPAACLCRFLRRVPGESGP
jgi:hypothetical protein